MVLGRAAFVVCVAFSALLLAMFGVARVIDGRARDAAIPVPTSMLTGRQLPMGAYLKAAAVLRGANAADGEAVLFRAEALSYVSLSDQSVLLKQGVGDAPASVRGWSLLSLSQVDKAPADAARYLSQALLLAPKDYWVAGLRARAAAKLWNILDNDTRNEALDQVRLLWDEPSLRPNLIRLLSEPGGSLLVTKAFAARRDDLVLINRWISAQARSGIN